MCFAPRSANDCKDDAREIRRVTGHVRVIGTPAPAHVGAESYVERVLILGWTSTGSVFSALAKMRVGNHDWLSMPHGFASAAAVIQFLVKLADCSKKTAGCSDARLQASWDRRHAKAFIGQVYGTRLLSATTNQDLHRRRFKVTDIDGGRV